MPRSVAATVNAERLMLLAWPRAILLQMAHPLIAAAVAEHSSFRGGPIAAARRLHGTVRAMLEISFGDRGEAERAIDGIMTIHRRVHGTLKASVGRYPAGTRYSAEDPALVRWVHLTLVDSILDLYPRLVAPLADADRDAYCAEAVWVPVALGARESDIPRTYADSRRAFDGVIASDVLAVGADAKAIADAVLTPPLPRGTQWMLKPVKDVQRRVTIGTLPAPVRALYGWTMSKDAAARDADALERTFTKLRRLRAKLPGPVAFWPAARRASRSIRPIGPRAESPSR